MSLKNGLLRLAATLVFLAGVAAFGAEPPAISFATVEEGRAILTTRDEFVARLSAFDRAARVKTAQEVSEEQFLRFVGENVLPWTPKDKEAVTAAWNELRPKLSKWDLPLPRKIPFIRTTGNEEGGQAYTRGTAIVLMKDTLEKTNPGALVEIITHELFHVLTRNAVELRPRLYGVIGFVPCTEPALPASLDRRRLTNPDAPTNSFCIRLQSAGEEVLALPFLYSRSEKYDPERGGDFFQYLQFVFLRMNAKEASGEPVFMRPNEVSGFHEQIGKNTNYIIHPEEILADNFRFLILEKKDVKSPEVLEKLSAALGKQ